MTRHEACNPRVIVPLRLSRKKAHALYSVLHSVLCTSREPLYPQPLHASLVHPPPPSPMEIRQAHAAHLNELVSPWFQSISVHQPSFLSPNFWDLLRCFGPRTCFHWRAQTTQCSLIINTGNLIRQPVKCSMYPFPGTTF